MDKNYTYTVEKDKENLTEVNVKVKVSSAKFTEEKEEVYHQLKKEVEVKGFRPGMAPKNLIETKLGPKLFEQTLEKLFPKVAVEIIQKEKLNPITHVHYHLEKVSEADGVEFSFHFEIVPEFEMPDFSTIKIKKEEINVTPKEVDAVIDDMFQRSKAEDSQKAEKAEKIEKAEKPEKEAKSTAKPAKKEKPDDKWVTELKIPNIKSIQDLKKEVKKQLTNQKNIQSEDKFKADVIDAIIEKAGIKVPKSLISREIDNREKNYKSRIENIGLKFDDFLKSRKIKLEDLRKDWEKDAEKRIAREILLVEIAKANSLKVSKEDIEKEISMLNDPELKKQYDSEQGRNFIATVIIQQKAVDWIISKIAK